MESLISIVLLSAIIIPWVLCVKKTSIKSLLIRNLLGAFAGFFTMVISVAMLADIGLFNDSPSSEQNGGLTLFFLAMLSLLVISLKRRKNTKKETVNLTNNKPAPDIAPKKTRAIKQGWRIGEVQFTYEDAQGNVSERHVIVHHADLHYIKGECLARNAERTFRTDRIIGDVVDCSTGEIINPYELHVMLES